MKTLLIVIVTWLSTNFDLPANYDLPNIAPLPAIQIEGVHYGADNSNNLRKIEAAYDAVTKTILLPAIWAAKTPKDLSLVVHEMVHHLQNQAGMKFECAQAGEKQAYAAQDAWLNLFGLNLSSAFEIDPFTLKISTQCLPF